MTTNQTTTAGAEYGIAPAGYRLPAATRLGPVRLQVADLERSLGYYQRVIGLRVLERAGGRATLGAHGDDAPLVELVERSGASPVPRRGGWGCTTSPSSSRSARRWGASCGTWRRSANTRGCRTTRSARPCT